MQWRKGIEQRLTKRPDSQTKLQFYSTLLAPFHKLINVLVRDFAEPAVRECNLGNGVRSRTGPAFLVCPVLKGSIFHLLH